MLLQSVRVVGDSRPANYALIYAFCFGSNLLTNKSDQDKVDLSVNKKVFQNPVDQQNKM